MDVNKALALLNDEEKITDSDFKKWKKRCLDVYYGMSLHIAGASPRYKPLGNRQSWCEPPNYFGEEYQRIFTDRLLSRHPREGDDTFNYRLSQYRPLTQTPFLQVIQMLTAAIFQDSNYAIEIPDEEDRKYIWDNNFEGYDLIGWVKNICVKSDMEDPNGIIVRIPAKSWKDQDPGGKTEVLVWYVMVKDIIYIDHDEVLFKRGKHGYLITDKVIWRFTADDNGDYYLHGEDVDGYYAHLFGRLPITVGGGIWNTKGYFDSYLVKAKAIADDYVSTYSASVLVDKEASHPFIIQSEPTCNYCDGTGKETVECEDCGDAGIEQVSCHVCHGKGTISNNPGERILVPVEEMDKDHIRIVNPDTTINSYHKKKVDSLYNQMLDALNLWKTDQAQSGAAKAIDQERRYLDISDISNHVFDKILYDTITDIIAYRNVTSVEGRVMPTVYDFQIVKPTQFQLKTSNDLLAEYAEGVKAGLPVFVRSKMSRDFIDKQYNGDIVMKKKAEVMDAIDLLYGYTRQEQQVLLLSGGCTREDIQKSVQLPKIIESLIREKSEKWFVDSSIDAIKEEIEPRYTISSPLAIQFSESEADNT